MERMNSTSDVTGQDAPPGLVYSGGPLPKIGVIPDWVVEHEHSAFPGNESWFAPGLVKIVFGVGGSWQDQVCQVLSCLSLLLLILALLIWVTILYRKKPAHEPHRYIYLINAVLCATLVQIVSFILTSPATLSQSGFLALVAVLETADQAFVYILYFYVVFCVLVLMQRPVGSRVLVFALIVSWLVAVVLVSLRLGITKSVSVDRDMDFYTRNLFLITSIPKMMVSFVAFCMLTFTIYWSVVLDERRFSYSRVVLYSAICVFVVIVYSVVDEIEWLIIFFHRYNAVPTDISTARNLTAARGVVVFIFLCILDLEVIALLTCRNTEPGGEADELINDDVDDLFQMNGQHARGRKTGFLTDFSEDSYYETASCGGSESHRTFEKCAERSKMYGESAPSSPLSLSGMSTEVYGSIPELYPEGDKKEGYY